MRMPGRQPSRDLARQEKSEALSAGQGVCSAPREAAGSWQTRRAPGNGRSVAGIWGVCCVLTPPAPWAPGCSAAYGGALRKPVGRALMPRIRDRLPERKGNACWV